MDGQYVHYKINITHIARFPSFQISYICAGTLYINWQYSRVVKVDIEVKYRGPPAFWFRKQQLRNPVFTHQSIKYWSKLRLADVICTTFFREPFFPASVHFALSQVFSCFFSIHIDYQVPGTPYTESVCCDHGRREPLHIIQTYIHIYNHTYIYEVYINSS